MVGSYQQVDHEEVDEEEEVGGEENGKHVVEHVP